MSFKETRTADNLIKSFAGESQARMRYLYAAKTAKKEGFEQICNIFTETAENEKEHAKLFLKHLIKQGLEGQPISIMANYPVGWSPESTLKNLEYAANGEKEEWTELYPMFAEIAEEEGYKDIALTWRMVAKVEKKRKYIGSMSSQYGVSGRRQGANMKTKKSARANSATPTMPLFVLS